MGWHVHGPAWTWSSSSSGSSLKRALPSAEKMHRGGQGVCQMCAVDVRPPVPLLAWQPARSWLPLSSIIFERAALPDVGPQNKRVQHSCKRLELC
mmetsp:Transcript_10034/g.26017  ORF Transcript_10034/g.26017 Transcript_10034/m.26017 type:complete len:95 (-) Transcript_10034:804-1088(-)